MDLGIVTSCHNYGRYLDEWASGVAGQTKAPTIVGIVDNGSTDDTPACITRAVAKLRSVGLTVVTERLPKRVDFGRARNAAVALVDTEWVMHADCDDVLYPWCVAEVAKYEQGADVIALGFERFGTTTYKGPRRRIYSTTRGVTTLTSPAPASGLSPFRRSFWEQRPYVESGLEGGWDTALWIGFAQLNARFVPTKRPCFGYRQHPDSVFSSRRRDAEKSDRVGSRLEQIRRGSGATVGVAGPPSAPERAAAWARVKAWWDRRIT